MNLLLTGATGYLGSHLARAFVAAGHAVTILKRSTSDMGRLADVQSSLQIFDLDYDGLEAAFKASTYDAVVHTATCYGRGGEPARQVFDANTSWPLHVLERAVDAGVPLFINTDTSLEPFLNPYALAKRQFREWGEYFAGLNKIRFVNVILEHFYGPGDAETKFVTHVIHSCLRGDPELRLTAGTQRRDFIFIDDVIAAYLLLLQRAGIDGPAFQQYGLGSGKAVAIRDLVKMIKDLVGGETHLAFGAVPMRQNEVMEACADIASLRAIGWQPEMALAAGIAQTIAREKEKWKG